MGDRTLFEYMLVVELDMDTMQPKVTYCFPPSESVSIPAVTSFCFPEEDDFRQSRLLKNETFSFTLTKADASATKQFGYCRRFMLSGVPYCYCILSHEPSFGLFSTILTICEERRKHSASSVFTFLRSLLAKPFPAPGESITVSTFGTGSSPASYKLSRPAGNEYMLDFVSFHDLFSTLSVDDIVFSLEALVLETRTIICSRTLGPLSSVINALTALLRPFEWQHVFIPVLPNSLLDYCCAPMPFLTGILSRSLDTVMKMPLEEVLIIDLEKKKIIGRPSIPQFPPIPRQRLIANFTKLSLQRKWGDRTFDVNIARSMLCLMTELLGHYKLCFDDRGKLDRDKFRSCTPAPSKNFMSNLENSQLWEAWVLQQEEMLQKGTIDQCLIQKASAEPYDGENIAVHCHKCNAEVGQDIIIYKGKPYCQKCGKSRMGKLFSRFSSHSGGDKDESPDKEKKKMRLFRSNTASSKPSLPNTLDVPQTRSRTATSPAPDAASSNKRGSWNTANSTPKSAQRRTTLGAARPGVEPVVAVEPKEEETSRIPKVLRSSFWRGRSSESHESESTGSSAGASSSDLSPASLAMVHCAGCRAGFSGDETEVGLVAAGRHWHPACFKCARCKGALFPTLKFKVTDGSPYHPTCRPLASVSVTR